MTSIEKFTLEKDEKPFRKVSKDENLELDFVLLVSAIEYQAKRSNKFIRRQQC